MDDFELLEALESNEEGVQTNHCNMSLEEYLSLMSEAKFYEHYRMTKEHFRLIFSFLKYPAKKPGNHLESEFEILELVRYLSSGSRKGHFSINVQAVCGLI